MSDAAEVNYDADAKPTKKAAKKGRKPPRRASFQKPSKSAVPFPGLTRTACADGCNAKGCVISGRPYCAHPTKGGLQAVDMSNPAALKRQQAARGQLDVRLDPDRFK